LRSVEGGIVDLPSCSPNENIDKFCELDKGHPKFPRSWKSPFESVLNDFEFREHLSFDVIGKL